MSLWVCVVEIYEAKPYPVVEHRFYGATQVEAMHYFQSHMKTDEFLRGCVTKGSWDGIQCRAESYIQRLK
jgi:hypothetical protein